MRVEGFGKIEDFSVDFADGINVVLGPNESGKTTLYKFIVGVLSGFTVQELEKYKPWKSDHFGGSVVIETSDGSEKTLSVDLLRDSLSQSVLERRYLESMSTMSDEEDIPTSIKADGTVQASLKRKMLMMEQANSLLKVRERIPDFESYLIQLEKQASNEVNQLKSELSRLRIERKSCIEIAAKKQQLLKDLNNTISRIEKLNNDMRILEEEVDHRLEELKKLHEKKLSDIFRKIEEMRAKPLLSDEQFEEFRKLLEDLKITRKDMQHVRSDIERIEERKEKTLQSLRQAKEFLKCEDSNFETLKLRIKNIELSYRIFETKRRKLEDYISRYQRVWKMFEENGDEILKLLENSSSSSSDRIRQLSIFAEDLDENIRKLERQSNVFRIVGSVSFVGMLGSIFAALFLNPVWFYLAIISGAMGASMFGFVSRVMKKIESENEQKIQLQLEIRSLQKEKKGSLQRTLESFGVNSLDELKEMYSSYASWKKGTHELLDLKREVEEGEKELFNQLKQYGLQSVEEMPSVILRLGEALEHAEKCMMETSILEEQTLAQKKKYNDFLKHLHEAEQDLKTKLQKIGLSDPEQLEEARKRFAEVRELEKSAEDTRKILEAIEQKRIDELHGTEPELWDIWTKKRLLKSETDDLTKVKDRIEKELNLLQDSGENEVSFEQLMIKIENISRLEVEIRLYSQLRENLGDVHRAISEEIEMLTGAYVEDFHKEFENLFRGFVGSSYNCVVNEDLSLKLQLRGKMYEASQILSRATVDQLLMCYKIALYRTLDPEDSLPLVIDNALIRFDETRLKKAIDIIKEEALKRQVIIFTSDFEFPKKCEVQNVRNL